MAYIEDPNVIEDRVLRCLASDSGIDNDMQICIKRFLVQHNVRRFAMADPEEVERWLRSQGFLHPLLTLAQKRTLRKRVINKIDLWWPRWERDGVAKVISGKGTPDEKVEFAPWTRTWAEEHWDGDTKKPATWTDDIQMKESETSSSKPDTSSNKPSTLSKKPTTSSKKPTTSSKKPTTSSKKPTNSSKKPRTAIKKPGTSVKKPKPSSKSPSTSTNNPSTSNNNPSTSNKMQIASILN
ncbi:hypothetical protein HYFRA_00007010 [Hymenoscyphus fraxineus]|uniref:Uncharacterized protein n=1 Tax=Hymenoscyphus fraxineus TaxID=746836 RepID=A0A9N9PPC6_9HELO|nr:hypothetical protein HYFRA_00007010 [Hymenoscyphus fraxineus]